MWSKCLWVEKIYVILSLFTYPHVILNLNFDSFCELLRFIGAVTIQVWVKNNKNYYYFG